MIKKSHRHTIMDGRVVTFARDFQTMDGIIGDIQKAVGPIEVSASRNKIIVHHAELRTRQALEDFKKIIDLAYTEHRKLFSCNGRPNDDWDGKPIEVKHAQNNETV